MNSRQRPNGLTLSPQSLPAGYDRRRTPTVVAPPDDTIARESWLRLAARCPYATRAEIDHWIDNHPALKGVSAARFVDETGILDRDMPGDFLDAVFGDAASPPRVVLEQVRELVETWSGAHLVPMEGGLMISSPGATAAVTPASGGVVLSLTTREHVREGGHPMTKVFMLQGDRALGGRMRQIFLQAGASQRQA